MQLHNLGFAQKKRPPASTSGKRKGDDMTHLSSYENKRAKNIADNDKALALLGLKPTKAVNNDDDDDDTPAKAAKKRGRPPNQPVRGKKIDPFAVWRRLPAAPPRPSTPPVLAPPTQPRRRCPSASSRAKCAAATMMSTAMTSYCATATAATKGTT